MRSIWFVTFVREKMSSKGWEGFCSYQLFYLPEGSWPARGGVIYGNFVTHWVAEVLSLQHRGLLWIIIQ